MKKEELKIVYMATADFALPALRKLVEEGYNIRAVVTGADKPAGRGMKLQQNSIKRYALEQGFEVLQPLKLRDESFLTRLREIAPDLGLVVAFRMLPEEVWTMPRFGTINLHGSLLPRYRGAAPIHWAVINGDKETGVTTFQLKHEIDTGDILGQSSTAIGPNETTGEVYERLMYLGADLLECTVQGVLSGEVVSRAQESFPEEVTHAPKLTKENTYIDWSLSASRLHNFVRGLCPFPSAWTELVLPGQSEAIQLKVHSAEAIDKAERHDGLEVGAVLIHERKHLEVVCGSGVLRILNLQPAGKRAMPVADFLNGLR